MASFPLLSSSLLPVPSHSFLLPRRETTRDFFVVPSVFLAECRAASSPQSLHRPCATIPEHCCRSSSPKYRPSANSSARGRGRLNTSTASDHRQFAQAAGCFRCSTGPGGRKSQGGARHEHEIEREDSCCHRRLHAGLDPC